MVHVNAATVSLSAELNTPRDQGEIQFLLDGNQQQSEIDQFERAISGTRNWIAMMMLMISSINSCGFSTNKLPFTIMRVPWELKHNLGITSDTL